MRPQRVTRWPTISAISRICSISLAKLYGRTGLGVVTKRSVQGCKAIAICREVDPRLPKVVCGVAKRMPA